MTSPAVLALLALLGSLPKDINANPEGTQAKLLAVRAELEALDETKGALLSHLDVLARNIEDAQRARDALTHREARLAEQERAATEERDAARAAGKELETMLGSELRRLDRLLRARDRTPWVNPAAFVAETRRERSLATVARHTLRQLDEAESLARAHAFWAARAGRLLRSAQQVAAALQGAKLREQGQADRLSQTLVLVHGEAERRKRLISDLQANDAELRAMVEGLDGGAFETSFLARRGKLPFPTKGYIEVGFGRVENPFFKTETLQQGIDIRAGLGTPVRAVAPGSVAFSGWLKGYGNMVILDHGSGYHSLYAHLRNTAVAKGATVAEDEAIGEVGDSSSLKGAYLYFEIRRGSVAFDPRPWLRGEP